MSHRIHLLRLALVMAGLALSSCMSKLTVETKIYTGPLPADLWARDVAASTQEIRDSAAAFDARTLETVRARSLQLWPQLHSACPALAGSAEDFAESFAGVVRLQLLDPLASECESVRREAAALLELAARPRPSIAAVREGYAHLIARHQKLAEEARRLWQQLAEVNTAELQDTLREHWRNDAAIRVLESEAAREEALAQKEAPVRQLFADANQLALSKIVDPLEQTTEVARARALVPHDDELLSELMKDENEKYWRADPTNSASVFTFLGNAEIAFRMDAVEGAGRGAGDVHIKGVVFDPSRVSQAFFAITESAVTMVASAYGLPIGKGDEGEEPLSSIPQLRAQADALDLETLQRQLARERLFEDLLREAERVPSDASPLDAARQDALAALLRSFGGAEEQP